MFQLPGGLIAVLQNDTIMEEMEDMEEMDEMADMPGRPAMIPLDDVDTVINLGVLLAKRGMSVTDLAALCGCHINNLSIFKNGRGRALKLTTLTRMCLALDCTPNDIIEIRPKARPASQEKKYPWYKPDKSDKE